MNMIYFIALFFGVFTGKCFCVPPTPTDSLMRDIREIKKSVFQLNDKTKVFDEYSFISLHTLLTSIDTNIKNLQERAHVWDTFQLHVSAWNDQLSTVDRKLDIISKAQEKIDDLDLKLNNLLNPIPFKIDEISSKINGIEESINELNKNLKDKREDKSLFEEFAARGILTTVKQVDKKIDKIHLNSFRKNDTCNKLKDDDILRDISSKVDVIFDKFSEKDDLVPEDSEATFKKGIFENVLNSIENNTEIIKSIIKNCSLERNKENITLFNEEPEEKSVLNPENFDYTLCGAVKNISAIISFSTNLTDLIKEKRLCEQGWLVIQKRFSTIHQENFNRSWDDYKHGFGNEIAEFWIGNDFLHQLSHLNNLTLRIELINFNGILVWAEYDTFKVANEDDNYRLIISGYNGTASDSFSSHNNSKFSTFDMKNDDAPICCPCALSYGSGWWFNSCFEANLNGIYYKTPITNEYYKGIIWEYWLGNYSLQKTKMMVKSKGNLKQFNDLSYDLDYEDP
nr:fibroleukin-like [Onthophagus taurus]